MKSLIDNNISIPPPPLPPTQQLVSQPSIHPSGRSPQEKLFVEWVEFRNNQFIDLFDLLIPSTISHEAEPTRSCSYSTAPAACLWMSSFTTWNATSLKFSLLPFHSSCHAREGVGGGRRRMGFQFEMDRGVWEEFLPLDGRWWWGAFPQWDIIGNFYSWPHLSRNFFFLFFVFVFVFFLSLNVYTCTLILKQR